MARSGGKGKVSNDLVAVSCAAVLAVYAAGYSRTRDAARRFETQALERKPARAERPVAMVTKSAAIETTAPTQPLPPETRPNMSPPMVTETAPPARAVAAKAPSTVAEPGPTTIALPTLASSPVALQQATVPPVVETSVAAVAAARAIEPDPASSSQPDALPVPSGNWRDGTYTGWGTSRHGDIKAQVVIKNGRIVESTIASCETRYPCDVISTIFNQPVERQNPDVDRVSRATESADAYYEGLVRALDDAQVQVQPAGKATTTR